MVNPPVIFRRKVVLALLFISTIFLLATSIKTVTNENTIGNDFLVFYLAAQSSIQEGKGPYYAENATISQLSSYGHLAQPGEDYLTFSYPPFSLIPILPLIFLSFGWAQAIWMSLLVFSLVIGIIKFFPQAPKWLVISMILVYPMSFGLLMGNLVVPIFLIILFNIGWILQRHEENLWMEIVLGVALAWTLAKPQFSWLYLVVIVVSALKNHRKAFLISMGLSSGIYLAISFLMWPTWIVDMVQQVNFYAQTNASQIHLLTLLDLFLPATVLQLIRIPVILISGGLLVWVLSLYWKGKWSFFRILVWAGLFGHLFYPGGVAYQQLIFLLPFVTWMAIPDQALERMKKWYVWFAILLISWIAFVLSAILRFDLPFDQWLFLDHLLWFALILVRKEDFHGSE